MSEHAVALQTLDPSADRSLERLSEVLDGARIGAPDEGGIVEVHVEADDFEGALRRVFDGIAATGADDHLAFAEHPDVPQHWRHRDGERPAEGGA